MQKKVKSLSDNHKESEAKFVILKPAGYPMKTGFDYPEISEPKVFHHYAKEQWFGSSVKKGDFLFDRRMYPDFAFEIVNIEPKRAMIGDSTAIIVENAEDSVPLISREVVLDDIIGQESAKRKCKLIEKYLKDPKSFGEWAPKNVLFYGPSGTGKTMMAKALSNLTKAVIIPVKSTHLIGEHVGEGATRVHRLYDRAAELAPCIVFIDELDAVGLDRSYQELRGDVLEIVNALLTELDGIEERSGICTIGGTNRYGALDPSIRSRFEEEIPFTLPNEAERLQILIKYSNTFPIKITNDVNFEQIAKQSVHFSGRDLVEKVLKVALHQAIIDETEVTQKHFKYALGNINVDYAPSILFG